MFHAESKHNIIFQYGSPVIVGAAAKNVQVHFDS